MSKKIHMQTGVDIGGTAVRVAVVSHLDPTSFSAHISKAAIVPLPAGAVRGGVIQDPHQVGYALREALKQAGVSGYGIVVGISSPEAVVTRFSLQSVVQPNEWVQAVRTASRDISPTLRLDQASLSVYGLPVNPDTPNKRTVVVGAVPREQVQTIVKVCRVAKAAPRAVDLSGAATLRCLARTEPTNSDVSTFVDVGSTKTTVITRQGRHVRSIRTFDSGSESITAAVMGAAQCTYEDAERYKHSSRAGGSPIQGHYMPGVSDDEEGTYGSVSSGLELDVQTPVTDIVASAVTNAANELIEQIAAAVETDGANYDRNPTRGIILCGQGSLLLGFKEQVNERIGIPVMLGRPWAQLDPSPSTTSLLSSGESQSALMLSLTTATGLAIWKEPV